MPAIHPSILWPLLVMAVGMTVLFAALHLKAMRNEILRRRLKALRMAEVQTRQRPGTAGGVSDMDLGPHAVYIWASYAVVAVVSRRAGRVAGASTAAASNA